MTWGSNPSYDVVPCPWCGDDMVDNTAEWPTTHMMQCPEAPWWHRAWRWINAPHKPKRVTVKQALWLGVLGGVITGYYLFH